MHGAIWVLADVGFEWWAFASSALAIVVGGVVLAIVKRRWDREDKREEEEQKNLKGTLNAIGLKVESECETRMHKDNELGRDIQDTRGALDWLYGQLGKERPRYRSPH